MRIHVGLLALIMSLAVPALAASPLGDAASRLDGHWRGDGTVLKIDSARAQASLDPLRPFEWQRFLVKEVSDETVVFTIGANLFEAKLDANALMLKGSSFRGERILQRHEPTTADSSRLGEWGMRSGFD